MNIRYEDVVTRNFGVYSHEDQRKIQSARIAIVGVGCDGGMAAEILARIGVGNITLIDPDVNEISNLNRQPFAKISTLGEKKVLSGKRILKDINPFVKISTFDQKLVSNNGKKYVENHDILLQCVDDMLSRIVIHRIGYELGIPVVTMTGQPPFKAFVSTFMPGGIEFEEVFRFPSNGQELTGHIAELIRAMKIERAKNAVAAGASGGWFEAYQSKNAGWGITPERSYITATLQSHEALLCLTGKRLLAPAPNAILIDLLNVPNIVTISAPPDGKHWDYRKF